jgi:hypothetical protein
MGTVKRRREQGDLRAYWKGMPFQYAFESGLPTDLIDAHGVLEALHRVLAAVREKERLAAAELADDVGGEDLAALGLGGDAGGEDHGGAEEVAFVFDRFRSDFF